MSVVSIQSVTIWVNWIRSMAISANVYVEKSILSFTVSQQSTREMNHQEPRQFVLCQLTHIWLNCSVLGARQSCIVPIIDRSKIILTNPKIILTTLPTKPVVRPVAQQPTFGQNSQLPASQPVGVAAVCSCLVAMGTSQLPASWAWQGMARALVPASCQPVRGPKHWCQPVASQLLPKSLGATEATLDTSQLIR